MGVCSCKNEDKKSKENKNHIPKISTNTLIINGDDLVSPKNKLANSLSDVTLNDGKNIHQKEIKEQAIKTSIYISELNEKDKENKKPTESQFNTHLETNQLIKETTFDKLINQTIFQQEQSFEEKLFSFTTVPKEFELFIFMK